MSLLFYKHDIEKLTGSTNIFKNLKWVTLTHSLHLVFLIRLGQTLCRIPLLGIISRVLIEYVIRILFASDISLKAKIGKGFIIMHGHDVVIGAQAVIGENCTIFNGVTLGNRDITVTSQGNQPTIGNNVVLSTGSKILGGISIGDNVKIGANAVVVKDCLANLTYVGVPAKMIVK